MMNSRIPATAHLAGCWLPRLALLALITACAAGNKTPDLRGADYYLEKGQNDYQKHRYLEAIESFQRIVSNFPGNARVAEAQYYLAESYFGMKDYVNAVFEYQRLVDTYPSSSWRDEAQYKIGLSWFEQRRRAELDQTETREAIAAFRRFIEDNPNSPLVDEAQARIRDCRSRLGKKEYLAARLYHRQGFLQAARMTYEQLLRDYPLTEWYCRGLAQLGDVARREGKLDEARSRLQEVLQNCQEEELQKAARRWLTEMDAEAAAPTGE